MSYDKNHTDEMCDKCEKIVGKDKLIKLPFIFLDRNDKIHDNLGEINPRLKDYHQYYLCEECFKKEKI